MSEEDDKKRMDEELREGGREGDSKLEGYWESISVPRDREDRAERQRRVREATRERQERAKTEAAKGRGARHEILGRALRGRVIDSLALLALIVIGLAVGLTIISQQKASLPAWVPIFGEDFFHLEAELSSAQALVPGQGQAVMIAGIEVGQIESTTLEDGKAIVGMNVEPEYAEIIRADAGALPRPKTNLQDMVIEIDPGTPTEPPIEDETRIALENTKRNINPDEFMARLDADTRDYLTLLLQGGAEGLGGRGKQLSKGLRRLLPFSKYIAETNKAVAARQTELRNVITNFKLLTEELSQNSADVRLFVSASADALGGFASQEQSIREAFQKLPGTLKTTGSALDSSNELATELQPTLSALIPQAKAFGPGLEATARFFENTEPTLQDQLRPFTGQVKGVVKHTRQLSTPLSETVDDFGGAISELNYGFNELAHNPGASKPGFLFYLPWLNHNLNSLFTLQDGLGPSRRGMTYVTCRSAWIASSYVQTQPILETIYRSARLPFESDIPDC